MEFKYITVEKFVQNEMEVKKSIFIASVQPVSTEEEAQQFIEDIRKKYKDATHNVFAYILGFPKEIKRYSDDGEPSGTAGLPILDMLEKRKIMNVAVVVTRYFGGTLLGTGGLVRAYGQCAKEGVEVAGIIEKILYDQVLVEVDYHQMGKVQNKIINLGNIIFHTEFQEKVIFHVYVLPQCYEEFERDLIELTGANIKMDMKTQLYLTKKENIILY